MFDLVHQYLAAHDEVRLFAGIVTWLALGYWTWRRGWRIQRRYLIEARLTPMRRSTVWWMVVFIGAVVVVAAEQRPASPALVTVAMVGTLSALVDARTHRLPDAFTRVMAIGVAAGVALAALVAPDPWWLLLRVLVGALTWFVPLWVASRIPRGMGRGDVKLAPVLGAMLGVLGFEAATFGLLLSFVAAGLAALWAVVVGSAGTDTRMPMGPWLIGGALISHLMWGVLPDWI